MEKIYNFFLRINTLNRAAFVMMLSVLFVGQVWGGVITFTGENLANGKTVGCVTLTTADMTHTTSGLYASSGNKTFTLTAVGGSITQIIISTDNNSTRYQKSNITDCSNVSKSGTTYTCTINPDVTVVSCKNHNGSVTVTRLDVTVVSEWKLAGEFGAASAWTEAEMDATATGASVKMNLAANQRYQFKFKKGSDFYGNTGAIVSNISGWVFSTDKDNCTLYTGPAGKYTFELNSTTKEVAVTYPTVSHPDPHYVYFIPGTTGWSNARIYNWEDGTTNKMSDWDGAPTITTQTTICGQDYYYCAAYFNRVKFRGDGTNQTKELTMVLGQYKDERDHGTDFAPFATYTISFDAGGGEGTMSAISGICPGAGQLIPTNGFTKSGYIFNYWTADQDVTVGGSVITAGDAIAAGATIENVGADITLTAQWRVKPAMFQYILGSCDVKDGVWVNPGKYGYFNPWEYVITENDTTIVVSNDISYKVTPPNKEEEGYFNSNDLSNLDNSSYWTIDDKDESMVHLFTLKDKKAEFNLGTLIASQIAFYSIPNDNKEESVTFTTSAGEVVHAVKDSKGDLYSEKVTGDLTGTIKIEDEGKNKSYYTVVIDVPIVKITYNANGGEGAMEADYAPRGAQRNLSANQFIKTDKVFGGWTRNADGSGELIPNCSLLGINEDITLYAKWVTPCEGVPTLTPIAPTITIWDGKQADLTLVDVSLGFDATGITYSLESATPAINGCTFSYYNSQIHIEGTPAVGNTDTQTVTVTFTIANDCDPTHTFTVTQDIRIYPATQKAKIAFIVTGTEGKAFTAYKAADSTACSALLNHLDDYFSITCVNGYATADPTEIANYYKDYDLLIVTDFLDTKKGYTNAIGTLIDKKPILSLEAFVAGAGGSNWHIESNPVSPSKKVKDMKLLCAAHSIFSPPVTVTPDTTVNVLSSLSSHKDAKGLQGFTINEAPDFLFLATIRDTANNRDLIVCCERQVVFPARLMLYGINSYEMGNISTNGMNVMKQMIDYLLLTDESGLNDCGLVFDDNNNTHIWSDPKNWYPGYNIVPTAAHPTRIIKPCTVDKEDAHAGSVKINRSSKSTGPTGKITILPNAGLTVAGFVSLVMDDRYANLKETVDSLVVIQANETNNGAFVYGNKTTNVNATVQYYSKACDAGTNAPVWQYIGIPFQAKQTAIQMYYAAWMCRWTSASDQSLGGLWQWVANEDILQPFEGYCITQEAKKEYTLTGALNKPTTRTLSLDNKDTDGYAFVANSWTAPIKISQLQDDDFTNAEQSIYIYHTGTYAEWIDHGTPVDAHSGSAATIPGQYAVVPIHSSPYLAGADSVIPAMQGFFVKTDPSKEASLKLVYNRVVYDAKYFKTSTQPMRAPSRTMELSDAPEVMVLTVVGDSLGADRVHILSRGDFSQSYEDGWDGRKVEGDAIAPKLSVVKDCGEMAVAAIETPEGQYLSFRAGEDSIYTFTFDYEGETIYLYDRLADEAAEIRTGNTYTFRATNKTAAERFLITATPPRTPTQVETVGAEPRSEKAEKIIHDNKLMILYHGAVYDAQGARVTIGKEVAR